ncbi:MAG TPA: zf-HC2 domain-containing protein, partial [Blastocatellia bacterium]|nr:zf-HC2 domain-containing protein [Blastocatellia bacterium]
MNCQRVEQLLPLFVEGDLKNKQVASVSLHLAGCENCKLLAEDFKQSQQWLRSSLPLEFDEGFFDGLRNSVHREIQQQTTRVSWP